jgi:DNA-binding PadR family transcriptional regulator
MHGYELRKIAAENRIEAWTGVLPGSIYHALKQMEKEGLVRSRDETSASARARSVYAITAAGHRALRRLVAESLEAPIRSFPTHLYGSLLFAGGEADEEVSAALNRQVDAVKAEIAAWTAARPKKGPMTERQQALYDNGIEHLRIDLDLVERLLTSGKTKRRAKS